MDPLSLDWGEPTAEFGNEAENSAVHVFNHDLTGVEKAARAARFALARVAWYAKAKSCLKQEVWFDERGQDVPADVRASIKSTVAPAVAGLMFFSEGEGA